MKKIILSLLAVGLVTLTSCNKYDQRDEIKDLKNQIAGINTTIKTNADKAASDLASASAALTASIAAEDAVVQAAIVQATEAIQAGQTALNALIQANIEAAVKDGDIEAMIVILQADIEDLKAGLSDLGVDVSGLEDDVDDLEDEQLVVVLSAYTPLLLTKTESFVQTADSVIDGIVVLTDAASRTINIGTTSSTITQDSTEHIQGDTAAHDVNNDGDHADSIRRTYTQWTYTGTVSGTNEVIGSHQINNGHTNWVVTANN